MIKGRRVDKETKKYTQILTFATGSMDRTAWLWRPEYVHPLRIYVGHEQDVFIKKIGVESREKRTGSKQH